MQGVKYLLGRITQLEADKALLLDEMENLKNEIDAIKKEVSAHGNDTGGNAKKDAGNGNEKDAK